MAWIELHQSVWTHRKTLMLAAALGLPPTYAAAHVIRLWTWSLDNAPDGALGGVPDAVIAAGAEYPGEAERFVEALLAAGYLEHDGDLLRLHDWSDYAGRLVERRAANAERMRAARAAHKDDRAMHVPRTFAARAGATGPDLTGPDRTGPDLTGPDRTGPDRNTSVPPPPQPVARAHEAAAAAEKPTLRAVPKPPKRPKAPATPGPEQRRAERALLRAEQALRPLGAFPSYTPSPEFFAKVAAKYGHLDLEEEALKMADWLRRHHKRLASSRFVLDWLGRAGPPPANANGADQPSDPRVNGLQERTEALLDLAERINQPIGRTRELMRTWSAAPDGKPASVPFERWVASQQEQPA